MSKRGAGVIAGSRTARRRARQAGEDARSPLFHNQPFSLAMRAASMRFPAPNLLIASER
jgi:hypothetical protein